MKSSATIKIRTAEKNEMLKCPAAFILIISSFVFSALLFREASLFFSQLLLFFTGWVSWTGVEYFHHRFWSHSIVDHSRSGRQTVLMHHHQHPTEISITPVQRIVMLLLNTGLLFLSFMLQNFKIGRAHV